MFRPPSPSAVAPLLAIVACLIAAPATAQWFGSNNTSKAPTVISSKEPGPGDSFSDCPDCPEMVIVPSGKFEMGSTDFPNEMPVRKVTLPMFAIGRTEVTQVQWRMLMGTSPSKYAQCDLCPVEQVNWDDAQAFIQRLRTVTGKPYRLPSEAEWEYACRAGGQHRFCGGDDPTIVAWTDSNSSARPHPVGRKKANAFGLHDMSGNVWEWVQDCWRDDYVGAPTDGSARDRPNCRRRVLRGGSWIDLPVGARATERGWGVFTKRDSGDGLRVALSLEPEK